MDAITESLARQQVAQRGDHTAHARRTAGVHRDRAARHSLARSLRRFADRLDS